MIPFFSPTSDIYIFAVSLKCPIYHAFRNPRPARQAGGGWRRLGPPRPRHRRGRREVVRRRVREAPGLPRRRHPVLQVPQGQGARLTRIQARRRKRRRIILNPERPL